MSKIIGIDLGTSNSAAAALVGGKPTIIQAAEGTFNWRQVLSISSCILKRGAINGW